MTAVLHRNPIWTAVALSLFLHLSFAATAPLWFSGKEIQNLSPVEKILRVRFPELEDHILDPKGRLVDIADQKLSEVIPPTDSAFLSDKNRSVERETRARITGLNPNSSRSALPSPRSKSILSEKGRHQLDLPNTFLEENTSSQQMASIAPNNYLPEIAMGDETLLNTREYAYASYFIRMKRQMEGVWNPRGIIDRYRLSQDQFITTVGIVLDQKGELSQVRIIKPSGNPALDQEALAAVQQAAPYLNPPKGLVETDGRIRIPQWNFIVTLGNIF